MGWQEIHAKLDRFFHPLPLPCKPRPVLSSPIIARRPVAVPMREIYLQFDVIMALLFALTVAMLVAVAPGDAYIMDLGRVVMKNYALESDVVMPRMVSADALLLLLSIVSTNTFIMAVTRSVGRRRQATLEAERRQELLDANDIDPEKMAAYKNKLAAAAAAREEKLNAIITENEVRKKEKKRPRRVSVVLNELMEEEAVSEGVVPFILSVPVVLGTATVLQAASPMRGIAVSLMLGELVIGAALPRLLNSLAATEKYLSISQSICGISMVALVAIQCFWERKL